MTPPDSAPLSDEERAREYSESLFENYNPKRSDIVLAKKYAIDGALWGLQQGRKAEVERMTGDAFMPTRGLMKELESKDATIASLREELNEFEGYSSRLYSERNRLEKELVEAVKVRDDLAITCLVELSGAGIPTPVEGYKDAPQFLPGDIQRLVKERDTLRSQLQAARECLEELLPIANRDAASIIKECLASLGVAKGEK